MLGKIWQFTNSTLTQGPWYSSLIYLRVTQNEVNTFSHSKVSLNIHRDRPDWNYYLYADVKKGLKFTPPAARQLRWDSTATGFNTDNENWGLIKVDSINGETVRTAGNSRQTRWGRRRLDAVKWKRGSRWWPSNMNRTRTPGPRR